ncbi:anhydro-N-acetylmuramic acid kinase [Rheinheimera sp.]|uniref:anhydro-N-acetylmuramic acid kinase n=1 Tax=Rheinheimera sp. TaxID=1869214 RepID=UPI00307F4029
MSQLYVGIMSGTSLDGIDLALVDFSSPAPVLVRTHHCAFPAALRQQLFALSQPGANEIDCLGLAEAQLAEAYAAATLQLLKRAGVTASAVKAIGCHGQTIRHRPDGHYGFTYQAGDMFRLAVQSQIRVISQFRQKDMALGGQGAPLVPAFHQAVFASLTEARAVVNIGGIANATLLCPGLPVTGFDTGPGNCLMDLWVQQHGLGPYDQNGDFAASGQLHAGLLQSLWQDPYFSRTGPKSTGREYFNQQWLNQALQGFALPAADVQRTLTRFTAETIMAALPKNVAQLYLCGGGAYNAQLVRELQQLRPAAAVDSTKALGIDPNWVEAMAFAWLAFAYDQKLPGNLPEVTGASKATVLGVEFGY